MKWANAILTSRLFLQRRLVDARLLGGNLGQQLGVDLAVLDVVVEIGNVSRRAGLNMLRDKIGVDKC